MPLSSWKLSRQTDFSGGENFISTPDFILPNQLVNATNCVLTSEGTLETRKGLTQVNSQDAADTPIISIHRYVTAAGTRYILWQIGTTLYGATWTDTGAFGVASEVKTGLTAAKKLRSALWRGLIIFTNGTQTPFSWNGTAVADLTGTPPNSYSIAVYGGKLWLVDAANPNQLRWSGLENPNSWNALDVAQLPLDGDIITGLIPQDQGLIILKSSTVWAMYGTNREDFRLTTSPLYSLDGSLTYDTYSKDGFFAGRHGHYSVSLNGVQQIALTHRSLFDIPSLPTQMQFVPQDKRLIVAHEKGEVINIELQYGGAATSWSGLPLGCMASGIAGDKGSLIIGSNTTNKIYYLTNQENDDGTGIETYIKTSQRDYSSVRDKVFRNFEIELLPSFTAITSVNCYSDIDYGLKNSTTVIPISSTATSNWGIATWGVSKWSTTQRLKANLWLHGVRGQRASFAVKSSIRVKMLGYKVKFREVGAV